ncbi:hypothetical protein NDU88_003888 [Pleurodeles waltl]|uniref:Uncharacterized protein n=1 Tax=Pleurodeles waltl TaxID=8319 RepID=A0AAV7MVX3_PLEWA|nr:hypothetical protein NDU88_003888 [Pleurodeles waltl]
MLNYKTYSYVRSRGADWRPGPPATTSHRKPPLPARGPPPIEDPQDRAPGSWDQPGSRGADRRPGPPATATHCTLPGGRPSIEDPQDRAMELPREQIGVPVHQLGSHGGCGRHTDDTMQRIGDLQISSFEIRGCHERGVGGTTLKGLGSNVRGPTTPYCSRTQPLVAVKKNL